MKTKKGRKKMSKVEVDDLNFDDIAGSVNIKTAEETKTISNKVREEKKVEDDYLLAIKRGGNSVELISLETCTSAQFFECMSQVYPVMGEANPDEVYNTRQSKVRSLKHVVSFHTEFLKPLRNIGGLTGTKPEKLLLS